MVVTQVRIGRLRAHQGGSGGSEISSSSSSGAFPSRAVREWRSEERELSWVGSLFALSLRLVHPGKLGLPPGPQLSLGRVCCGAGSQQASSSAYLGNLVTSIFVSSSPTITGTFEETDSG
ncbi:hypothetical protein PV375_04220 [Gulosibacter sp. GYB002]|uniref:hypothetical protein n=1 Tax=Gulosibacter sp. GYB002 TaxID=2994391 RepID=UPI002F96DAD8